MKAVRRVSHNPHIWCSQYRTDTSALSSALAVVLDNSHHSTLVRPFPSQVHLFHRTLRLSSCHVYASRLLGAVRAVCKATIRTDYVFSPLLLSASSHLPSLAKWGAHLVSSPPSSPTTSACPSCSHHSPKQLLYSQLAHSSSYFYCTTIRCTLSQHQIPRPIITCHPFHASSIPIIL